jgi:hypothetical protein
MIDEFLTAHISDNTINFSQYLSTSKMVGYNENANIQFYI